MQVIFWLCRAFPLVRGSDLHFNDSVPDWRPLPDPPCAIVRLLEGQVQLVDFRHCGAVACGQFRHFALNAASIACVSTLAWVAAAIALAASSSGDPSSAV
jgi:hypothetical protein